MPSLVSRYKFYFLSTCFKIVSHDKFSDEGDRILLVKSALIINVEKTSMKNSLKNLMLHFFSMCTNGIPDFTNTVSNCVNGASPTVYIILRCDKICRSLEGEIHTLLTKWDQTSGNLENSEKPKMPIECGHPLLVIFDEPYFGQPTCISSITRNDINGCHSCTIYDRNLHQKLTF